MDSRYNKKNGSQQKKSPPTRHRPDEDEDTRESSSSTIITDNSLSKSSKMKKTNISAEGNNFKDEDNRSFLLTDSSNAKIIQHARTTAMRAAPSGMHRKPPPPGPSDYGGAAVATKSEGDNSVTAASSRSRAGAEARAKSRGRRPTGAQRLFPSRLRNSVSGGSSKDSSTSSVAGNSTASTASTKLQRLQEEVAAKATGRVPSTKSAVVTQLKPAVFSSAMDARSSPDSSNNSCSFTAVKQLNRMEADIAAKQRARATRGSGTARAAVSTSKLSNSAANRNIDTTTILSLNRTNADIAAKARVKQAKVAAKGTRASAFLKNRRGNGSGTTNAKAVALAKKLGQAGATNSATSSPFQKSASSAQKAGTAATAANEPRKKKEKKVSGDDEAYLRIPSLSKASKDRTRGGNQRDGNGAATLPDGNHQREFNVSDKDFRDESKKSGDNNLAVAVAVYEDENENVFIPSAVEYDPDAKQAVYKSQRFRVYSILTCTLMIVIAACAIGVLTILEKRKAQIDQDWFPTEPPTCTRCTMAFAEQLELEVGSQKLWDPASPEYKAMQWILHEDEMELLSTDENFVQRYLMAVFYFDTHQLADWRSCNRKGQDQFTNDTDTCNFEKLINIIPEPVFEGSEAKRWLGPESECDWAGILCDESNKIRSIDIHGQGIQGTLPDSFTRLPYLQTIAIQWNNFTGPLPPQFGLMKHLIHLEMHYNQFTGTFPATWSNARNLQLVNIANNRLTGQLPADIGNFRNLKGLYLYNNDFSGTLPPQLSNAKTLAFVRFQKNNFQGTIPTEYGEMQLIELWLHGNNFLTGTIPTEFGKLSNFMTDLRLGQSALEGTIPEAIYNLRQLWRLELQKARFSGTISQNISNLEQLQRLTLNSNSFTGEIPEGIGSLSNLVSLDLKMNQLTGSIPSGVCGPDDQQEFGDQGIVARVGADCLPDDEDPSLVKVHCECCLNCCNSQQRCEADDLW